jgi:hypothetical protein
MADDIGGKGLLLAGVLAGFFIIPPLANAAPRVVNMFLLLILTGILLLNSDQWLPLLDRFVGTVPKQGEGGQQTFKKPGGGFVS